MPIGLSVEMSRDAQPTRSSVTCSTPYEFDEKNKSIAMQKPKTIFQFGTLKIDLRSVHADFPAHPTIPSTVVDIPSPI
jgi:hypothetical protein